MGYQNYVAWLLYLVCIQPGLYHRFTLSFVDYLCGHAVGLCKWNKCYNPTIVCEPELCCGPVSHTLNNWNVTAWIESCHTWWAGSIASGVERMAWCCFCCTHPKLPVKNVGTIRKFHTYHYTAHTIFSFVFQ